MKGMLDLPGGFVVTWRERGTGPGQGGRGGAEPGSGALLIFLLAPQHLPLRGYRHLYLISPFTCSVRDLSVIREGDGMRREHLFLHPEAVPTGEVAFDSIRQVIQRYASSRMKGRGRAETRVSGYLVRFTLLQTVRQSMEKKT